jgi:hypothetical protein
MGRADIVLNWKDQFWVMELKVAKEGDNEKTLLKEASDQIINQRYAKPYDSPICLAMVINDKVREITLYKAFALPLQKTTAIDNVLPAKKKKIRKN